MHELDRIDGEVLLYRYTEKTTIQWSVVVSITVQRQLSVEKMDDACDSANPGCHSG
jgi:hypothetical protein